MTGQRLLCDIRTIDIELYREPDLTTIGLIHKLEAAVLDKAACSGLDSTLGQVHVLTRRSTYKASQKDTPSSYKENFYAATDAKLKRSRPDGLAVPDPWVLAISRLSASIYTHPFRKPFGILRWPLEAPVFHMRHP